MFKSARMWLAEKLIGDTTALYLSKEDEARMKDHKYLSFPDDILGKISRRWFVAVSKTLEKTAAEKNIPVSVYSTQSAVLSIAQFLKEANATEGSFAVNGTIDGGVTKEDFEISVTRRPHDPSKWDDDAPSVEQIEDEDGKIISLAYRIKNL